MIKPKYFNTNGTIYYRTGLLYYHTITKRTYSNEIYNYSLKEYTCLEAYGGENSFLCFVLSNFTVKNTIDTCYILYEDDQLLDTIKHDKILHVYEKCNGASRIIYINLIKYISKLVDGNNYALSIIRKIYNASIDLNIQTNLDQYKLCIYKSIPLFKKYLKNFNSIPDLIKKDLDEISKLIIDLETINKKDLNYILKNILNLPDYNESNTNLNIPLNKFNNLKIIYNNYDSRRILTSKEIELFNALKEYDPILKKLLITDPVYIQLKGIKFCIDDRIIIDDGFKKYSITTVTDNILQYILTVCNIEYLKSEIEKIILK